MSDNLQQLAEAGVSIWLDDLSREWIETGNLADLVKNSHVVGVTTNPSIFATALADGERYDDQVRQLAGEGADVDRTVLELTTTDVRNACDVLAETFKNTDGVDGRVSIEVTPGVAHDTDATVKQAADLWKKVDRHNLLIKIPGTKEGCPAITETLGVGISVNVTLIFGLEQYHDVMEAFIAGVEKAKENGHDLSKLHSVASFFVSRVDTEIDKRLDKAGGHDELLGKAGVANARLAYEAFEKFFDTDRWAALATDGARRQRPLWASTGVKNPDYDDTMYVVGLAVEETVNTMPEKTLDAVADHGKIQGDQVRPHYADARQVMADLQAAGIDYDDVIAVLIKEGVDKFVASWDELLGTVHKSLDAAHAGQGSAK
ncbi:MAG: transaldolase [Actinomycetota bacterium]|nr:transaldolase [Actinomycetota bacterium]